MTIIGRLTKDAVVSQLNDERKVVNFTVATNDSYKPKGSDIWKVITTYFDCAYWQTGTVATRLNKGNLVEVSGRVYVSTYKDMQGEIHGTLRFHVDTIRVHQQMKKESPASVPVAVPEDLPF